MNHKLTKITLLTLFIIFNNSLFAKEYSAKNSEEIKKFSKMLKPGDTLSLSNGEFRGGITFDRVKGTKDSPIVINGAGVNQTIFKNGKQAIHLIDCHYITLRNFSVQNFSTNGINADDGGSQKIPSTGITLENISIKEIGPKGNFDGLKLSGLHKFMIKNCYFSGWGGSAIDMVGCHSGRVQNCTLEGKEGFSQNSGIQIKGGSSDIKVIKNTFKKAGQRGINLGGSTGEKWFRPLGAKYEAKNVEVAGNTFIAGMAHIAFVTSEESHIHHNLFYKPEKWFFRILQETQDPSFIKTQKGKIEKNIFVFDDHVKTFINIGSGTAADTFVFNENLWQDINKQRKPKLPVKETKGVYNTDLKMTQFKNGSFRVADKYKDFGPFSYTND